MLAGTNMLEVVLVEERDEVVAVVIVLELDDNMSNIVEELESIVELMVELVVELMVELVVDDVEATLTELIDDDVLTIVLGDALRIARELVDRLRDEGLDEAPNALVDEVDKIVLVLRLGITLVELVDIPEEGNRELVEEARLELLADVVVDTDMLALTLIANTVDVDTGLDDVEFNEVEKGERLDVKLTEDDEIAEEVAIITDDVILKEEDVTYCDDEAKTEDVLALFETETIDELVDETGFTDVSADDVAKTEVLCANDEVGITDVPRFSGAGVGIAIICAASC
jgi:hypothetical protein